MSIQIKMWIARMAQYLLYFIVPLKKNRIMFYAHNRRGYVDNPRYIMEYLDKEYAEQFELIWVSAWPETCEPCPGIEVVGRRSFRFFLKFIRTKILVTNDMVDENLVKKKGQIFLTTWHGGGAYKKVGLTTCGENKNFARAFKRNYQRLDYFVSSCKKCSEFYPAAFGIASDKFIPTGTPRNDLFFQPGPGSARKVREFFHIAPETKIILYAPSFRLHEEEVAWEAVSRMMNAFNQGDSWVCLYRAHYFKDTSQELTEKYMRDGNSYYEMQELLCAADLLITDFSSCMWDFMLTGRPIIRLESNMEDYEENERGFFVSRDKWPFPVVSTLDEIYDVYTKTNWKEYRKQAEAHLRWMGSYETGNACDAIAQILLMK